MNTGLHIRQLSYARHGQELVHGLELRLKPGQGLLIGGPNGSGKTSLLRVLAGLICPSEGSLSWNNQTVEQARLDYHQALHFLGHQTSVKNKLTVKENLTYSQGLANHSASEKLSAALEAVELLSEQHKLAQQLSAGQKRRLALARLLVSPKPLWLLDEPFTNLDQSSQQWFSDLMETHLQNQGLVILATHQPLKLKNRALFQTVVLPFAARDPKHV